jgi:hypothetical protein
VPQIAILLKDYLHPIVAMLYPDPNRWAGMEDARAFAAGVLRVPPHPPHHPLTLLGHFAASVLNSHVSHCPRGGLGDLKPDFNMQEHRIKT